MSVVYCEECDSQIDTDFDSEHWFDDSDTLYFVGRCENSLTPKENTLLEAEQDYRSEPISNVPEPFPGLEESLSELTIRSY